MKLSMLMMILALSMSAQTTTSLIGLPDLKITLEGIPGSPVLVNDSGRNIIAHVLRTDANVTTAGIPTGISGFPELMLRSIVGGGPGIASGSKAAFTSGPARQVNENGSPLVPAMTYLDSVVFDNGQFAGPDSLDRFHEMTVRFDAARALGKKVLADQSQIGIIVQSLPSDLTSLLTMAPPDTYLSRIAEYAAARELQNIETSQGPNAVNAAAERLVKLPTLWK